jgi:23S rRNA (uracil1939-C5)-methyltransferase
MKRGERVIVAIDGLTAQGDGLGRAGVRRIAVAGAVPGDRVEVAVRGKRRGHLEGRVEAFLEHGCPRRQAPCQHFGVCGGCRWQDLDYPAQLQLKERMVAEAMLARNLEIGQLLPIRPSPAQWFYRNKMEYSFGVDRSGQVQLGMHVRERYNRLFDVEACHLLSARSNRIVRSARTHAAALGVPVYDLRTHQGVLRFLVVREARPGAETMVVLVVAEYPRPDVDELAARVRRDVPEIATFVVALHQGKAQVAVGQREFVLAGSGRITERCGGLAFEVSPRSFFQTNPAQAEQLYRWVAELADGSPPARVLDLYCGTGGISLHLARQAAQVVGVELVAEAVVDARANAERNGLSNCRFLAGPVEEVLEELQRAGEGFDVVVADPPRTGLHPRALAAVARLGPPALVYVSCNPFTLAPDLESLAASGYEVEQVQPVDMFPQTPHCEVVARLRRRG